MDEMTPTEIDRKVAALCGLLLDGNLTEEKNREMQLLLIERRRRLCSLPRVPKQFRTYRHQSY